MDVFRDTLTSLFRLLPKYRSISLASSKSEGFQINVDYEGIGWEALLKSVATAKSSLSSDHSQ